MEHGPRRPGDAERSATQDFCESDRMKIYPNNLRARLTGVAGAFVPLVIALFVAKPMIERQAVGAYVLVGMIMVGGNLGNIVDGRLFKPWSSSVAGGNDNGGF